MMNNPATFMMNRFAAIEVAQWTLPSGCLVRLAWMAYIQRMRLTLGPRLRRIASTLMLAAMALFLHQIVLISVSQAAAAVGLMPQPAEILNGSVHVHDGLAGHVHVHGGNAAPGHVHLPADVDHADHDDIAHQDLAHDHEHGAAPPISSLCSTAAVIPAPPVHAVSLGVISIIKAGSHDQLHGVEPGGLNRPPSTPSIA